MADERAQRRLAAILAADVVGYSRLMELDEAGTLARLKERRREILSPLVALHHGRIVKVMGDGVLVEFASAVDAVECAIELQSGMGAANSDLPEDRRIVLRVGINLGDVIVEGGDLYGDGVNIAARVEALAEPGGIFITGAAYDQTKNKVKARFEDLGSRTVKNLRDPIRVYRVAIHEPQRVKVEQSRDSNLISTNPSIAVLPLENMRGDAATARLADGITGDIIADLARFRGLDVIARHSTAMYRGRSIDVRQVGRDLSVRYVLEGSIQRQAGRVRITAQLIDAWTGGALWSDRWDRPDKDIFAVQTEVAERVAGALGGMGGSAVINVEELRKARRRSPADLTAYDHYLLANEGRSLFTKESLSRGLEHATRAIALDPTLSRAYVARAWLNYVSVHAGANFQTAMEAMRDDATQALTLDSNDAEARGALAFYLCGRGRFEECEAQIQAALQTNPSNTETLVIAAAMRAQYGKPGAAELADRAMRLSPSMTAENLNCIKDAYFFTCRFEDVIAVVSRIPLDARGRGSRLLLTLSYALLGRTSEMELARTELIAKYPSISAELLLNQDYIFARQQEDLLLDGFRKAGLPLCAADADLALIPNPRRLPECVS